MTSPIALPTSPPPRARTRGLQLGLTQTDILWLLLALTLVRGVIYAVLNPPFGSPDERDHFQYVQTLATTGLIGERGAEGHQPIPYYALMVPAYSLAAGYSQEIQYLAIRLASLPFLLGTVLFTWLAGRKLAPDKPFVPAVAAAFVALHPQLAYIGASVNNDAAANFMGAVLTYLVVSLLTTPAPWTAPVAALALGAALMTKGQVLPVVAIFAAVLLCQIILQMVTTRAWRISLYALAAAAAVVLAVSTNEGQILVARAQNGLSILSRWPEAVGMAIGLGLTPFSYQFISFWAAFVGESIHPSTAWYVGPSLVVALGAAGYAVRLTGNLRGGSAMHWHSVALRGLLALAMPAQWTAMYVLHLQVRSADPGFAYMQQTVQGRYLLVFVAPLALLVAEGWSLALSRGTGTLGALGIVAVLAAFDAASLASLAGHYNWPLGD